MKSRTRYDRYLKNNVTEYDRFVPAVANVHPFVQCYPVLNIWITPPFEVSGVTWMVGKNQLRWRVCLCVSVCESVLVLA